MSTMRIDPESLERLKKLAAAENCSMQALLKRALETYETSLFFQQLDRDFQQLREDPAAWSEYQAEAETFD